MKTYQLADCEKLSKQLYEALKATEWSWEDESERPFCKICWREKESGHAPDCQLRAALDAYESESEA